MKNQKGYILIIVLTFMTVLAISAASIFLMVGSEAVQMRRLINTTKAYYAAEGGAERMFAFIAANPDTATNQALAGSFTGNSYSVTTGSIYEHPAFVGNNTWGLIEVASSSTVGGISKDVTVEYEVQNVSWGNSALLTLGDQITLQGHKKQILWFWVYGGIDIEGPVASSGTIIKNTPTDAINVAGQEIEGVGLSAPQFMSGFDANRDNDELTDVNGDGDIAYNEIPVDPDTGLPYPAQEAIFLADDVNGDNLVNEKDGFTNYYTKVLNYEGGGDLGIDTGGLYYYSGNQTFGPGGVYTSVPSDTNVVFVDGDVDIVFNPSSWGGGARDITVISTGNTTIIEPSNGSDDRLTLVNYGDVTTGGLNIAGWGIIDSNMNVYAHDSFNAYYGGDTDGTIISNNSIDIDTIDESALCWLFAREVGNNDNIVTNPPTGLPPMSISDNGDLFVTNLAQIPLNADIINKPYSWAAK